VGRWFDSNPGSHFFILQLDGTYTSSSFKDDVAHRVHVVALNP
jgi:hypothetical protein